MLRLVGSLVALTILAAPAHAYIDISPSLGWLVKDAASITVLEVEKVSAEKRVIIFRKVADLKGEFPGSSLRHHIADGYHPREPRLVMDWAEPGKLAICFSSGRAAVICTGRYWYECAATRDGWWTMTTGRPELALAFYGRSERLRDAVTGMLAGKEVVITAVNHGARTGVWQYNNVAFQKVLRGKDCPLWRLRASLEMPGSVWQIGAKDSRWVVGPGVAGVEDIPALLKTLDDKSAVSLERCRAASELGLIGWQARSALPALLQACRDDDPMVRVRAGRASALVSDDEANAVVVLSQALEHEKLGVRKAAAIALGDLGTGARGSVVALRNALQDPEPAVRWAAAEALGRIGPAAVAAVPDLAEALREPALRIIAADALGGVGPAARGAVPLLADALKSDDPEFRWTAAVALTRIDARAARAALPLFIEKLRTGDLRARWDALMFITPMGHEAKEAATAVRLMSSRNGVAAATLAAIAGAEAIDALPTLLHVLADDWDTSESIAQIGPAAIPELLKALKKPDATNGHLVLKALGLILPRAPEALPPLLDALENGTPGIRKAAAEALAGARAEAALPALRKALEDDDAPVRLAVAIAVRAAGGPQTEPAVPALIKLVSHERAEIRREAAATLADFGPAARPALPALAKLHDDRDAAVRGAGAWAAARIRSAAANRVAVSELIAALKDEDPRARQEAARFLGTVGPDARDAISALAAARHDDNEDVRRAATEALVRIQGK